MILKDAGIRLTKEEAAKLPNTTWPIHGLGASKEEGYLGALYVFHELHCLVSLHLSRGFITHVP